MVLRNEFNWYKDPLICWSKINEKEHIFISHKYFCCFAEPSTVCVDKALDEEFTYTVEIKN